jgi:hypothetical protein
MYSILEPGFLGYDARALDRRVPTFQKKLCVALICKCSMFVKRNFEDEDNTFLRKSETNYLKRSVISQNTEILCYTAVKT